MSTSHTLVLGTAAARQRGRVLVKWMASAVAAWIDRERSRRMLASFDGRMLRDIGMTDADRRHECAKPFWRE